MALFSSPPEFGLRLMLRESLCKLTCSLFSWRSRRMIFLSSIYGMVTEHDHPDTKHAAQLSKVLNLAKDYKAMEFPVAIKSVIWSHTGKDKVMVEKRQLCFKDLGRTDLTENECDVLCQHIVSRTPFLLQYAKASQMVYDVKRLAFYLQNMGQLEMA